MLKKVRFIYYFKHLSIMSTINKVRTVLTGIGIFVAVFLFSSGIIVTNSYYNGQIKTVNEMLEQTAVVYSPFSKNDIREDISNITAVIPTEIVTPNMEICILSTPVTEDSYITVMANIHGISNPNSPLPVVTDDNLFLPREVTLIEGRNITMQEILIQAPVVVIDAFTAELLFPGESAVGKTLLLDVGVGGNASMSTEQEYNGEKNAEIIGVVDNSYISEMRRVVLKRELSSLGDNTNVITSVSVYCPVGAVCNWFSDEDLNQYYVYEFDDSTAYQSFMSNVSVQAVLNQKTGNAFEYFTKDTLISSIEEDLSYTKGLLNLIIVVLCIISGISIMSVTMFSVKERIPEIGIRKAFGANKIDIVFQFLFEMLIVAFFVSVIATSLSFYGCKFAERYLATQLFVSFHVEVSLSQLLLPVSVGMLEALLSSIIPSLYAANIKVTDSLRFE